MEKQRYRVSFVFEFDSIDDVEAKRFVKQAEEVVSAWHPHDCHILNSNKETKIQRIFDNKPPERITT